MNKIIHKLSRLYEIISDADERYVFFADKNLIWKDTDEKYLYHKFKTRIGRYPELVNPKTFNEKLQWLKLHDRKDIYTMMVDKYEVKKYISEKIGKEYVIPTLGIWNDFDDINFDTLPNQFVLKTTHDSGGVVVCTDKNRFNKKYARNKLMYSLKNNFYKCGREWPYKNVKPRIIAEEYLKDNKQDELIDYKLMCFNGKVKVSFVCNNRFSKDGLNVTFYDNDWNRMPFERHYPASKTEINKPASFNEMIRLAEKLSENIPFVRVDFYEVNGKIYFGELTFFPGSGMEEFTPEIWDYKLGDWLDLPIYN